MTKRIEIPEELLHMATRVYVDTRGEVADDAIVTKAQWRSPLDYEDYLVPLPRYLNACTHTQ